jgi:hypothetical protein
LNIPEAAIISQKKKDRLQMGSGEELPALYER